MLGIDKICLKKSQILSIVVGACIGWSSAVLIGHNGDHGNYYPDYTGYDGFASANEFLSHHVLPTVAVPVHSVSASPYHADPIGHELHHAHALEEHHEHHEHHGGGDDHDYYVSFFRQFLRIPISQ